MENKNFYQYFPSSDEEVNKKCLKVLEKLEQKGEKIKVVPDGLILEHKVILPFIQTPEGARWFGEKSIKKYAEEIYPLKNN